MTPKLVQAQKAGTALSDARAMLGVDVDVGFESLSTRQMPGAAVQPARGQGKSADLAVRPKNMADNSGLSDARAMLGVKPIKNTLQTTGGLRNVTSNLVGGLLPGAGPKNMAPGAGAGSGSSRGGLLSSLGKR